jgi:hypothetical protein
MPLPVIQFKRGAYSDLPGLALGEPGVTTDTRDFYIGFDGTLFGNRFFGSDRYWRRESSGSGGGINLYENTDNGTNFIGLRAPSNVPSTFRYYLPPAPINDYILSTDGDGNLFWTNTIIDPVLSGEINVDGNISVGGTSSKFNTEIFDTQARIFNVGLGTASPSNTTWDLGVLFNYYKSSTRYRSGIFWDDSTGRIGIASNVSIITNEFGAATTDPVIDTSSVVYAPMVIGALWLNDCSGESQVISCSNSERNLENISVDGGFY